MAHKADHDRVVMASLKADGTPDQTPDFTFIGNKEFAKAAAVEQRKQQLVSAADVDLRGASASAGDGKPDKAVQKIKDAHEAAAKSAESAGDDVDSRFEEPRQIEQPEQPETRRTPAVENTTANRAPERAANR